MKDIITRLTETVGDNIAKNNQKNEFILFETKSLNDISSKDLLDTIKKEDPELYTSIMKYAQKSDGLKKLSKKPKRQSSSSYRSNYDSDWSNYSCGRSRGGCSYSSSSWGGGCGSSSHRGGC